MYVYIYIYNVIQFDNNHDRSINDCSIGVLVRNPHAVLVLADVARQGHRGVLKSLYIYIYIYIYITNKHIYIYIYTHTCVYMYIHIYIYIHVSTCVYIYIEREN